MSNNEQDETPKARMLARIYEELSHYFTWQMRKNYSYIQKVTPAVLRMLHFDLTGNAATNNGFKGTKFDTFWNEIEAYFNKQIRGYLYNPLPSNINVLSDKWICLQFCPTNAVTIRAMYYTGQFKVKFQVQGRMLQKSSEDTHYCAALFRYLREFCIQYRQWACLISADNKHKIPIGEEVVVSTDVRNRCSIVTQGSILAAADHDFSKLSLMPSVYVSYKDTIFEPKMLPILCLYTNGGPNHRCNYGSVQIVLIGLFLCGDFDLLVAVRVALKRDSISPESENLFGMVNTLGDIRKKAEKSNKLESELKECIMGIQEILKNQTVRLRLKNNKFKYHFLASQEEITEVFE
ncbi:6163_t:CDS:2, partial [Gigaspora margarita]